LSDADSIIGMSEHELCAAIKNRTRLCELGARSASVQQGHSKLALKFTDLLTEAAVAISSSTAALPMLPKSTIRKK